jgi:Tetratricopeptide repeat
MASEEIGSAREAFTIGIAALEGRAAAGPDDPFEIARGALISAVAADDSEWSPRAAYVLGMALFDRGDLAGAATYFAVAQRSGHAEWSVGGLIGQAHLAARDHRPDAAATLFRQVIETGQAGFLASAWYNLGTIHQQQRWCRLCRDSPMLASASGHRFADRSRAWKGRSPIVRCLAHA